MQMLSSILTCKAGETLTDVTVLPINTGPVVLARSRCTLINVDVTVVTLETGYTEALVRVHAVDADGPIPTGLG